MVMLACAGLTGCSSLLEDHRLPGLQPSSQVQKAVDSVRFALEKELGNSVPSVNVLIQTPTQTYFVSSVSLGRQPLTPNTFFRFASNTKTFTGTAILKMY